MRVHTVRCAFSRGAYNNAYSRLSVTFLTLTSQEMWPLYRSLTDGYSTAISCVNDKVQRTCNSIHLHMTYIMLFVLLHTGMQNKAVCATHAVRRRASSHGGCHGTPWRGKGVLTVHRTCLNHLSHCRRGRHIMHNAGTTGRSAGRTLRRSTPPAICPGRPDAR